GGCGRRVVVLLVVVTRNNGQRGENGHEPDHECSLVFVPPVGGGRPYASRIAARMGITWPGSFFLASLADERERDVLAQHRVPGAVRRGLGIRCVDDERRAVARRFLRIPTR